MNFLTLAALELALLSLLAGIVGSLIVLRSQAFFAVALSHATFPGGVIAALIGANVLLGQAVAALLLALLLSVLSRVRHQGQGAATGIVLVAGFALGSLLTSLGAGATVPLDQLLIGSLFGVRLSDIWAAAAVTGISLATLLVTGRQLLFDTFDRAGFVAAGFNPRLPDTVTAVLVAAAVVVSLPAVGAILAVALLVGPAATAQLIVRNVRHLPLVATIVALAASGIGLWASQQFAVAAGGAVSLAVALLFCLAFAGRRMQQKMSKKQ